MVRKTRRSKSYRRRNTRRNRRGGACPCAMRLQSGGRGGMGGAELGHAYTTGASQALYQLTGRTPGLSSGGGSKATKRRRTTAKASTSAKKRPHKFHKKFITGMPIMGYEGNKYKHLSRNEIKNKIKEEAMSEYVRLFGNENEFNKVNLKLNEEYETDSDSDSEDENMGENIIPAGHNYKKYLNI